MLSLTNWMILNVILHAAFKHGSMFPMAQFQLLGASLYWVVVKGLALSLHFWVYDYRVSQYSKLN